MYFCNVTCSYASVSYSCVCSSYLFSTPRNGALLCIYVVYSCSLSPSVGCFMCSLYDVNIYLHIYYKDVDLDYCIKIVVLQKKAFCSLFSICL